MPNHTIIIAEGGVNHNGSLDLALQLVKSAKDCGADYIKFQTFSAKRIVNKFAPQAEYQKKNIGKNTGQLEMLQKLELKKSDFIEISQYCKELKIGFLSSPFDIESICFLRDIGMDFMKIPSGEITNLPYLREIASTRKPIILSTGMSTLGEIEDALRILINNGTDEKEISLLHCNTEYPTPYEDVNLKAIETLKTCFGLKVGLSDHTKGIEVPIAAVAMGSEIIEKHFTLDPNLPGPDHIASLSPVEMKSMINSIRNVEKAIGDGKKIVTASEKKNKSIARKSIVAAKDIKQGEVFTTDNITVKRPGVGLSPMMWDSVIGTTANRSYLEDELITL